MTEGGVVLGLVVKPLKYGLREEGRNHDYSNCLHLRELIADMHVKMISGCTIGSWPWLYDGEMIWVRMHLTIRISSDWQYVKCLYKRAYQFMSSLSLSLFLNHDSPNPILSFLFPLCSEPVNSLFCPARGCTNSRFNRAELQNPRTQEHVVCSVCALLSAGPMRSEDRVQDLHAAGADWFPRPLTCQLSRS